MKTFATCFGFFILCWIVAFFVIHSFWMLERGGISGPILFGGAFSIVMSLLFGLFNELWIQHRQY